MRTERDTVNQHMQQLSDQLGQFKQLKSDVGRISRELAVTKDSVTRMEALVYEHGKIGRKLEKHSERVSEVKMLLESSLTIGQQCTEQIGSVNSAITQRINNLELMVRQISTSPTVSKCVSNNDSTRPSRSASTVAADTLNSDTMYVDGPLRERFDNRNVSLTQTDDTSQKNSKITVSVKNTGEAKMSEPYSEVVKSLLSEKSFSFTSGKPPSSLLPKHVISDSPSNTRDGATRGGSDNKTTTSIPPSSKKDGDTVSRTSSNIDTTPGNSILENEQNELKGFIPVERRTRYAAFYLAGVISIKNNVDDTIQCTYKYLSDRGITPKSVKKLKVTGNTVAFRVLIQYNRSDLIMSSEFWPEGILCRKWIY